MGYINYFNGNKKYNPNSECVYLVAEFNTTNTVKSNKD